MPFPYSIDDIRAAYAETDMSPHPNVWYLTPDETVPWITCKCGCPIGCLFVAKRGLPALQQLLSRERDDDTDIDDTLAAALGITVEQLVSFTAGFDHAGTYPSDARVPAQREAFDGGWLARKALCPEEVAA
jgi:hypothetical protein